MVEGVFELHPAVREALFAGVALGGRVDRHQAAVQGMPDQQVAGPELALDEHEIAGRGLLVEPGENRPHPGEQALLVRRHVHRGPACADALHRLHLMTYSESLASIGAAGVMHTLTAHGTI